jgi:hypothetical protein
MAIANANLIPLNILLLITLNMITPKVSKKDCLFL